VRIDVSVQYTIVRSAILVIAFGAACGAAAAAFGCGGQVLGDAQGSNEDGTIDNDSGVATKDAGPNGVVAIGKCPSGLPGPALIPLLENGGIPYCVDATEVSNGDYAKFIALNLQPNPDEGACSQNSSFLPEFGWPAAPEDVKRPVVNVDWCDARAYCAWAGKKLCGAPGGVSGNAHDDKNSDTSLWYSACSNSGADLFPYGQSYGATTCNGADANDARTLDVDQPSSCINLDDSRILDMSGNVWEWEDACEDDTPTGRCRLRGGSFRSNEDSLSCAAADLTARDSKFDDFGFRCCAE
jgi:sulfatase modifying factor 1